MEILYNKSYNYTREEIMQNIVKIIYKKQTNELNITCSDKVFDVSRIKDVALEQWVFPFSAKGTKWKGLYEELKLFTESDNFILHFDSDNDSFEIVKHALSNVPVKLVGTNNIATIIYHENPFTTKIMINGSVFDTMLIQNRCIDEWINPIKIRELRWDGLFKELEKSIGTDIYTLYFVGEQKFMELLIDNCPENVNIFYRDPKITSQAYKTQSAANAVSNIASKVNEDNISAVKNKAINAIKQSAENTDNTANTDHIPIKNSFIRNNILALCAACSLIFLVLPFASFSVGAATEDIVVESTKVSVSGFEALVGVKEIKIGSNSTIFAIFLLIIPLLIITMNYIKPLKSTKKWIAIGAPVIGILFEIITLLDIKKIFNTFLIAEEEVKLKTSLGIGFFLILISYILTIIVGLIIYHNMRLPKKKKGY